MHRTIKKLNTLLHNPRSCRRLMFNVIKVALLSSVALFSYLLLVVSGADGSGYFSLRETMSSIAEHAAATLMLALGGAFAFDAALKKL